MGFFCGFSRKRSNHMSTLSLTIINNTAIRDRKITWAGAGGGGHYGGRRRRHRGMRGIFDCYIFFVMFLKPLPLPIVDQVRARRTQKSTRKCLARRRPARPNSQKRKSKNLRESAPWCRSRAVALIMVGSTPCVAP